MSRHENIFRSAFYEKLQQYEMTIFILLINTFAAIDDASCFYRSLPSTTLVVW